MFRINYLCTANAAQNYGYLVIFFRARDSGEADSSGFFKT